MFIIRNILLRQKKLKIILFSNQMHRLKFKFVRDSWILTVFNEYVSRGLMNDWIKIRNPVCCEFRRSEVCLWSVCTYKDSFASLWPQKQQVDMGYLCVNHRRKAGSWTVHMSTNDTIFQVQGQRCVID